MATVKVVNRSSGKPLKAKIVTTGEDLRVFVTENEREARGSDFIWFFDEKAIKPDAEIFFVKFGEDLKIKYVDKKFYAKWVDGKHKLQNRIG